jgi:hypothetical protein
MQLRISVQSCLQLAVQVKGEITDARAGCFASDRHKWYGCHPKGPPRRGGVPNGSAHTNDVFVSYAHADNEKPLGSVAEYGWVTTLAHNLNTGPNHYHKKLFDDHQLKPGDEFSDDLLAKVAGSRLLLLLLSQNYIDSDWCGKELDHFIHTHANDPNKPADVFVVELFPFENFAKVPVNVKNLRKHLINAKFWHQAPDASAPLLAGDPTPLDRCSSHWSSGEMARKCVVHRR